MPEPLTSEEIRVLGSLLEMQASSPKNYPPTLGQLTHSCNKKNGRYPVTDYRESQVQNALDMLEIRGLAETIIVHGSRTNKYAQTATAAYNLTDEEAAVFCVLLLRGPQNLNEIYNGSRRLYKFRNTEDVEEALHALSIHEPALVTADVDPVGQKDSTYNHLLAGKAAPPKSRASSGIPMPPPPTPNEGGSPVVAGLTEELKRYFSLSMSSLRAEVRALRREVEALRRDLEK